MQCGILHGYGHYHNASSLIIFCEGDCSKKCFIVPLTPSTPENMCNKYHSNFLSAAVHVSIFGQL